MPKIASASAASRRWRRRLAGGAFFGAAIALAVPLALAWGCVPGATIGFDRAVYEYRADETVTVLGRAFAPSTQVTLDLQPPSGPSTRVGNGVLTDTGGNFRDFFALPASAASGAYLVVASVNTTDVDGHGRTYDARETFTVMAPPETSTVMAPPENFTVMAPPVTTLSPAVVQDPILAPAIARAGRSITLAASRVRVANRRAVILRGRIIALTDSEGCASRQTVVLQRRRRSAARFKTFSRARSNSRGAFRKLIRPTRAYTYRARLPETARCMAAVSKTKRMLAIR
ncbi:MAG: hypothetical protein LC790_15960 [Actinobacteria bacterium]|nr:hypothetical protein [Actinomycetota bacterium]